MAGFQAGMKADAEQHENHAQNAGQVYGNVKRKMFNHGAPPFEDRTAIIPQHFNPLNRAT